MNSEEVDSAVLEFLKKNPLSKARQISDDENVTHALRQKFSSVMTGDFDQSYVSKELRLSLVRLRRAGKVSCSSNSLWVCKTDLSKYLNMRFDVSVGELI